jgi:hypothetical protein
MAITYDKEELIYESATDISNKYGMGNNVFYIRVIRRVKIKPRNLFRRQEKKIVYYDIEYNNPRYHEWKCTESIIPTVKYDAIEHNNSIREHNYSIERTFTDEMWKAQNFCLKYKTDKCDNGTIRIIHISL